MQNYHFNMMFVTACLVLAASLLPAIAAESDIHPPPDLPEKDVVLVVQGKIKATGPVRFDLATIQKFPAVTFTTMDPWDKKKETYRGVRIIDLLDSAGLMPEAESIEVTAHNDYIVGITLDDLKKYGHILSYEMNGKPYADLSPEYDKGPLAVAIDFDRQPELNVELYKQQLVWWVKSITVK